MGFQERIKRGIEFEIKVADYLKRRGNHVLLLGADASFNRFVELFRRQDDSTSEFIRFMPDGMAFNESKFKPFLWDAKSSFGREIGPSIERKAYENYMLYANAGAQLFLFYEWGENKEVYFQRVNRIKFWNSEEIVYRYPEDKRYPIEDGWITPRARSSYRHDNNGSGTPFRYVNLASMFSCKDFHTQ